MALKPSARYPGQIDISDAVGYPHGKAQNILVEGDGTGTPFEKDLVNDILGFQQALLAGATITPSGVPDKVGASQYLAALLEIITKNFGAATKVTVHTASATGVPIPAEVTEIEVTAVAGGGGGSSGAGSGNNNGGCGGGSGRRFTHRIPRSMVGDTYDVTIGAGGTGGVGGLTGSTSANVGNSGGETEVKFFGPGNDDGMSVFVRAEGGHGGGLLAGGDGFSGGGGAGTDAAGAGDGGELGSNGQTGGGVSGRPGGVGEAGASVLAGAGSRGGTKATATGVGLQAGGGGAGGPLGADGLVIVKASDGAPGTGTHTNGGKGGYGFGAGGGGGGQGAASGAGGEAAPGAAVVTFHYGPS